VPRLGVKR